ncbi:MAG: M3 family metallopeptidase [Puniceicoccales bacterium]|jgi:oligopeptidase A|nr:M3 family metallopeptidase [Puniceicoccales bacterium]
MSEPHPFLSQDFLIRWSRLSAAAVEADIALALRNAAAAVEAVAAQPAAPTFANTVLALADATRELGLTWAKVEHLASVLNTPEFREVHNKVLPEVTAFLTGVTLNPRLWAALKTFAATPAAAALVGVERRLLDETLADFAEGGADLPEDGRKRLETLNAELARLAQKYTENVLDATNAWEKIVTDKALLAGLPESALAAAAESAKAKGRDGAWRFTLHAPSLLPVLQYAENDALRRECWEASARVGAVGEWDNSALVWQILALRHEKARLLGKENFADFATSRRMVKSGANALRFVEDLYRRVKKHFDRETSELEFFKKEKTVATDNAISGGADNGGGRLAPWELAYWAERQRREKLGFDSEALRPYLPIGGVIDGMFAIFGKLFGIRVVGRDTIFADAQTGATSLLRSDAASRSDALPVEVWHPEVKYYEVFDGGTHLGSFYTDWHPRETKRGGAWMNFLNTGGPRPDGARAPHLGLICGNFTPGVGGAEPHLTHDEALTIFHEFGHLLHHILSEVPFEALSGVRVAWDFVELPSQLLENWCWQKESLAIFARHRETGLPPPEDLLKKLAADAVYRAATATFRQLALGKLDLELHIRHEELKGRDLDDIWNNFLADYQVPLAAPTPSMARRFTHIFGDATGYAAGYYSYKWAEVLEADVFTRFLRDGILNESAGRELREKIFAKGNSEPPEKLFRDFMGRDPDPNALLVREGLAD